MEKLGVGERADAVAEVRAAAKVGDYAPSNCSRANRA